MIIGTLSTSYVCEQSRIGTEGEGSWWRLSQTEGAPNCANCWEPAAKLPQQISTPAIKAKITIGMRCIAVEKAGRLEETSRVWCLFACFTFPKVCWTGFPTLLFAVSPFQFQQIAMPKAHALTMITITVILSWYTDVPFLIHSRVLSEYLRRRNFVILTVEGLWAKSEIYCLAWYIKEV